MKNLRKNSLRLFLYVFLIGLVRIFAILRVCNPGIKDYELKEAYENSFLSEAYPDVALSRNTVCKFLNDLGKAYSRIVFFMRNRTKAVCADHHLLIDGTLKTDSSTVDSLSGFSRKARVKGTRDISVMYDSTSKPWSRYAPNVIPAICLT